MPIATIDMKVFKTTNGLGGVISATESVSAVSGNVFDVFSGAETAAGGTFYACVYLKNTHGSLTAQNILAWIDSESTHVGVNVSLAKGSSVVNGVEQTIANEKTTPVGVTFVDTDTTTTGEAASDASFSIADIPSGEHQALWVRVTVDAATTAKTGYQVNTKFQFDTAE